MAQNNHTDIQTIFTEPTGTTTLLYNAEQWIRLRLELQTAGPVAVGTRHDLGPLLSGRGILLPVAEPIEFIIPVGDRFYYISETINRINFTVEAIAYGTTGIGLIAEVRDAILNRLIPALPRMSFPARSQPRKEPTALPCPPAPRIPFFGKK